MSTFASTLSNKVYMLEAKLEDAESQTAEIYECVEKLKTVEFDTDGSNFKNVRLLIFTFI